ncbi:tRNA pseudouridine(13) synthase TruD [Thalassotalea sp. PP2-459]|uniref:tRNA pseudouridine(13) synthase TruD n=1 Tax=Thalassotalea sp. PP2-459 TaxID=1742724 RepID=UPI0020C98366|nr:tRNA pseudouridine(13) synthase TruD [Thalassotalea sp. PP2-459]
MSNNLMSQWRYLFGKPEITGDLRTQREDFKVFEILPFLPSGEGEHLLIHLRKTGLNTTFVAKQLASFFNVKESLVTYAGLKDRFAVTEQWFGVHLPGKAIDNLDELVINGVEILSFQRHNKKLRIGALSGNRFEITLRNISDIVKLQQRWQAINHFGVPNYFGEQRFGIDGENVNKARELFSGKKVKNKKMRGIYLSAARSFIFNHLVSSRIEHEQFDHLQVGDALMLSGTQSVFKVDEVTPDLKQRLAQGDVDLTAAMWGKGELFSVATIAAQEQKIAALHEDLCHGLIKHGLKQERRRIRLMPRDCHIQVDTEKKHAVLTFSLDAGCFATSVLRELLCYQDLTVR